jgi:NADPH-dependent curcumin reductase CurA
MINRRIVLARRPQGVPCLDDFALREEPVRELRAGEVLIENLVFAIDPATRGMLDDRESYMPPVPIGGLIPTMVLGRVVQSRNPAFREGDFGRGFVGWEQYSVLDPANITIENLRIAPDLPLTAYMGALGWSGITAYVGLHKHGEMTHGETVAISAAAGAVGNVAAQIARLRGNRVVGTAGGADKAALVRSLGVEAIDHRAAADIGAAIRDLCPEGVNLYFDNVGGAILDAMLPAMADFGRIVVCGMVANYNDAGNPYPIRNLWQVLVHRITMRGFLAFEHQEMLERAEHDLAAWMRSGELVSLENVTAGLENSPAAFIRLMAGETSGKTVVRL